VLRLGGPAEVERPDTLVVEEPLEIRVGGKALAVTMRTPGSDMELAAGFLVSEGVISAAGHVLAQRYCAGATEEGLNTYNVLDVSLAAGVAPPDPSVERAFYTTSSCGLCGKASLDAVRTTARWSVAEDPLVVPAELLAELPDRLREAPAGVRPHRRAARRRALRRRRRAARAARGRRPAQRRRQGGRLGAAGGPAAAAAGRCCW
jgi:FdhD protein